LFLVALGVGWYYLRIGMKAIFVFRNNEPLASWVGIIAGPLSILPATLLALFKRKLGGYWLIAGGLISFCAFLFLSNDVSLKEVPFLALAMKVALLILLPMLGLGLSFVLLSKGRQQH